MGTLFLTQYETSLVKHFCDVSISFHHPDQLTPAVLSFLSPKLLNTVGFKAHKKLSSYVINCLVTNITWHMALVHNLAVITLQQ